MRRMTLAGCMVAFMFGIAVGQAQALTHVEVGDAGDLPGTAQTAHGTPLTLIVGTIASSTDADMYLIQVVGPFGATTVGLEGTLSDSKLYLFDLNGNGVWANDDAASGSTIRSAITDDNLPLGCYYLAISGFGLEPFSAAGQIFNDEGPPNTQHGPDGPGGGSPITNWVSTSTTGDYVIELRGVAECTDQTHAVPEPVTAGLSLVALAGLGLAATRRR